jgi:hypothetical protein
MALLLRGGGRGRSMSLMLTKGVSY